MKPLNKMTNVEKGKLLFELFPESIISFIDFSKQLTESIIGNPANINPTWIDNLYTTSFWFDLASSAKRRLDKYGDRMTKSSKLFADQLFDGYDFIYASHCMHRYITSKNAVPIKFKEAIQLLFF